MSRTIENRVVEMQFKNQQFESAVAKSINSIKELNNSINLLEGTKALKSLDTSVKKIDFSGLNNGMAALTDRFSTLGIIGASAINTITSAITTNLMGALSTVSSKISGIFSDVLERGTQRAMAIQQAKFSFQGLISTNGEGLDELETAKRIEDIMAAVNESVRDTPYSLAKAASAASILAAAYGTSEESIGKMETTLKTISGLAAQTGASYESVADVMSNVASSGVLMGEDLRRMQNWGLGVKTYLKNYINDSNSLKKEMNRALTTRKEKRSDYQEITEADIKDLASKGMISAEMVNDVFGVFFNNAQKANETLNGVTENIGAALGRLGALFMEPILENSGPYVKFLQTVKSKISDISTEIKKFKIDENVVSIATTILEKGNELLQSINVSDFSIFERIGNVFETISSAMDLNKSTPLRDYYQEYTNIMDSWKEKNITSLSEITASVLNLQHAEGLTYQELLRLDPNTIIAHGKTAGEVLAEIDARLAQQTEDIANASSRVRENLNSMYEDNKRINDVWSYDYFASLTEAINNFKDAFSEIGNVIFSTIGEQLPELKEFFEILTGERTDSFGLREIINGIAETIKNASEKFKTFVEENEPFRNFLKGVGSAFTFVWKGLKAIKEIAGNAFESFKPLFERLANLGGIFGEFLGGLATADGEADSFAGTVEFLSGIIDKFAKLLISVYDGIEKFITSVSGNDSLQSFFEGFLGKIKSFSEKIGPFFDGIIDSVTGFFDFISGKTDNVKIPDIFGMIKSMFGGRKNSGESIDEPIDEAIEGTNGITDALDNAIDFLSTLDERFPTITKIINGIKENIANILTADIDTTLSRLKIVADIISEIVIAFAIFRSSKNFGFKIDPGDAIQKSLRGFQRLGESFTKDINPTKLIKTFRKANELEAISDIIKSVAIVIGAIAASILILTISLRMIASIKQENLIRGGITLGIMTLILVGITAGVILLSKKIVDDTAGHSEFSLFDDKVKGSKANTPVIKMIKAIAIFIGAFAAAILVMSKSLKTLSEIPEEQLARGRDTLAIISGIIFVLVAELAFIVYKFVDKFGTEEMTTRSGLFGRSRIDKIINSISGILLSITGAVKVMTEAVIKLSSLSEDKLENGTKTLVTISAIIGILMAEIMVFMYLILDSQVLGDNSKAIAKTAAGLSIMLIIIAGIIYALATAVKKMAEVPVNNLDKATKTLETIGWVLGAIGAVIGIVTALIVSRLSGNSKDAAIVILSLAAVFVAVALLMLAVGESIKALSDTGTDMDTLAMYLGLMATIIGLVGVVVIALVVLTGSTGGLALAVVAALAGVFLTLSLLFLCVGEAVKNVGTGVDTLVSAITRFVEFFANIDQASMEQSMTNIGIFMANLGGALFTGLIGVANYLDKNKKPVVEAIKKVIAFILEAVWAAFVQTFQTNLEGLTQVIEMLDQWLNRNKFEIERIITNVGEIIFTAINSFMDNLMKLIFGDDYSGDTSGLLGQLTTALIGWFRGHFIDEGSDGRTLLRDTMNVIGEEVHQGILDFLAFIQNSQDIPVQALATIDSVIGSIGGALVEKGPDIIDHVKELMRVVWDLIKYALGIGDRPTSSMYNFDAGEEGDPDKVMDDASTDIMSGLESADWFTSVKRFLSKFWTTVTNMLNYGIPGFGLVAELGSKLVKKFLGGMEEEAGQNSPWKTTKRDAVYALQGFGEGLKDRTANKEIDKSARDIASRTINIVSDGMSAIDSATSPFVSGLKKNLSRLGNTLSLMMSGMLDSIEAKISPYLDLTQIEEGFGSIQDMMNGNSEFDINSIMESDALSALSSSATSSEGAGNVATDFDEANMPDLSGMNEMMNPETILNFTQNNYSPESLSRIDIYRDTKNMLSNKSLIQNLLPNSGA